MILSEQLVNRNVREVQYFFYSQALADGFRATFAILLPALLGSYFGYFEIGLTIALGAMCVSLTDAPGPLLHKRNGMMACAGFAFFIAIITAFARTNPYTMAAEVALVTFFFSMFVVYGARATGVGNAAILVMILSLDRPLANEQIVVHAGYLLLGGLFYLAISLLLYKMRPYRHAQRVLGDCIREVADYLSIRADFYNTQTDLETTYKRMVAQHVVVNEKQDLVREVFFKTRQILEESTDQSRKLVYTFVETVDLFEDITAAYHDYRSLREMFGESGALDIIYQSLKKIVDEVNAVGLAIQSNTLFRRGFDYDEEVRSIKNRIDALITNDAAKKLVLRRIIVNIRKLLADLRNIEEYFEKGIKRKKTGVDHSHFVSHQSLDPKLILDNLNLKSVAFRHSIRVCLACVVGFALSKVFPYGEHSYWILLTIAFIIKPAFSLTKQRNIERIIGTVAGGLVGVAILLLVEDRTALFIIMVVCMLCTYSFMRINYLAMVTTVTPYVLILFSFLGTEFRIVATERIVDTLIGCAIAFSASYFLFPNWEAEQLKNFMRDIVKSNAAYLEKIIRALSGQKVEELEYKLARRDVYLNSANLSAAFQRMLSEPKNKQGSRSQIQQFVVLNHLLFSNIANVAASITRDRGIYPAEIIQLSRNTYAKLNDSSKKLGKEDGLPKLIDSEHGSETLQGDDQLLKEQLNFIYNVSRDIEKLSRSFAEKPLNG